MFEEWKISQIEAFGDLLFRKGFTPEAVEQYQLWLDEKLEESRYYSAGEN